MVVLFHHQQALFGVKSISQIGTDADFSDRISKLEAQNRNQDDEIVHLKSTAIKDKKITSQLKDRVVHLETMIFNIIHVVTMASSADSKMGVP